MSPLFSCTLHIGDTEMDKDFAVGEKIESARFPLPIAPKAQTPPIVSEVYYRRAK